MSYVPAASGAVYRPAEDAATCVLIPVASLTNVKRAPGMAAPDGSVTLPVRPAFACACSEKHGNSSRHGRRRASKATDVGRRSFRGSFCVCFASRFRDPFRLFSSCCGMAFVLLKIFVLLPCSAAWITLSSVGARRFVDVVAVRGFTPGRRVHCRCRSIPRHVLFGIVPATQRNPCAACTGGVQRRLDGDRALLAGQ